MPLSANAGVALPRLQRDDPLVDWVPQVHIGKLACVGTVTLTPNATSTTVADIRAGAFSFVGLAPSTARGASAQGAGTLWVSTRAKRTFTITHTAASHSSTASSRAFTYCILG